MLLNFKQTINMLSIKNLHASIGDKEILKGINIEVKAGEVHAIMGPNGSGKSTLAAVIAGNENFDVTEGDVLNGIAYNPKTKTIFVTGKNWDKMFEISVSE